MQKIGIIIQREYWVRVKKKSFIIMTFLTPLLFVAVVIIPTLITRSSIFQEEKIFQVLDQSGLFTQKLRESSKIKFQYIQNTQTNTEEVKKQFLKDEKTYALLIIPPISSLQESKDFRIISKKSIGLETEIYIREELERIIREEKMKALGISQEELEKAKAKIKLITETQEGKESNSGIIYVISFISALLIYMSVLIYGAQVMRSVIEEKTNRIVEVIISSVKPIELMLGKIIGVAGVGLTQFLLWIILLFALSNLLTQALLKDTTPPKTTPSQIAIQEIKPLSEEETVFETIGRALQNLNIPLIVGSFLFYFLGGYLLYSALFAAIGSAGDSETDAQQFTLPVTIPLIIAFIFTQNVINDPNSSLAFWLSMIPLTSPIIMMVRIPSGVATWEIVLSMVLLIIGFLLITWIASRIYRIGILTYGKKASFKELMKWIVMKS